MRKASIFELIRTAELVNDKTIIHFLNSFTENVGISQILVLSQLREKGPQKQSQLANTLGYTPGAMTGISNKLIELGYAERKYDENDRNATYTYTDVLTRNVEVQVYDGQNYSPLIPQAQVTTKKAI